MTRNRSQTDSDRRPRTISLSLRDRGQTTQDFAVGIGVFILAIAFVFSFLPTMLTPFDSSVTGGQTAQADRIADRVVHNLSESTDRPNEIDGTEFSEDYAADDANLSTLVGLRSIDQVNIRLEHPNGSAVNDPGNWTAGSEYRNQSAASSARLVTVGDTPPGVSEPGCDPACRLVVRVW
ncbi:DUF7287 family protein [Haloterrigena alkaliphila]|uniref:Pilin/flagellin n=1 Tax=Haloterrigena alkaliphila TaxID=2816475 RepID=A0A8A2V884_9EURY|nr:hypothetical protein [Haloterrigena alkaliphila]QSW98093.1 hypothetical protein J0X25_11795 [Haloterrigena alkaliphila]